MEIYCDNAATTAIDPEVIKAILPYLTTNFGNPSSSHWAGRKVREAVDAAREIIAELLNASPNEIFFTSGATEANNLALTGAIKAYGINHVITSRIEHKAVLQTLTQHEKNGDIEISFVKLDDYGNVDLATLEALLRANPQTLISLMHGNNEVGNLTDIEAVGEIAHRYNAIFHTDTTQTMGKLPFDLQNLPVDFLVGSAHKFHGPKGIGFIYINQKHKIAPHIYGGAQEKGQRGGTENVSGIVGLAKALEIAYRDREKIHQHVFNLKKYLLSKLDDLTIAGINYNGASRSETRSLSNILNASFPTLAKDSLVSQLDFHGVAVSGGSACSNLIIGGSHVINTLYAKDYKENVRFSFSKFNTFEQLDFIVKAIVRIYQEDNSALENESVFRQSLRKVS
jgi:cysteine desulfurase